MLRKEQIENINIEHRDIKHRDIAYRDIEYVTKFYHKHCVHEYKNINVMRTRKINDCITQIRLPLGG